MNWSFYVRFFGGILVLMMVAGFLYQFSIVTLTITGGFVLYFLVEQLIDTFKRYGLSEKQTYLVLALGTAALFVAFILYVSIPLFEQVKTFSTQLPETVDKLSAQLADLKGTFPFIDQISAGVKKQLVEAAKGALSLSGALVTALITIPIITITLLATRKEISLTLKNLIPNDYFEVTMTIVNDIVEHVQDYVGAKSLETIAMMIIQAVGFELIGLPHGLLLGIVAGLLNIIPYLGPLLSVVPVGLVALVSGDPRLLGLAIAVIVIAQLIDNTILQTVLLAKYVDVHPLIVVIVTLVGGELLGAIGLIAAIPLYVISKILILGWYDCASALERRSFLLEQEESEKHHDAHS